MSMRVFRLLVYDKFEANFDEKNEIILKVYSWLLNKWALMSKVFDKKYILSNWFKYFIMFMLRQL